MSDTKSGSKDTGSVGDMSTTSSVSRNESSHSADFAEGGDTAMFGQQHVGPQKAGTTAHDVGGDSKFAAGGAGKMFGFRASQAAQSGITSAS